MKKIIIKNIDANIYVNLDDYYIYRNVESREDLFKSSLAANNYAISTERPTGKFSKHNNKELYKYSLDEIIVDLANFQLDNTFEFFMIQEKKVVLTNDGILAILFTNPEGGYVCEIYDFINGFQSNVEIEGDNEILKTTDKTNNYFSEILLQTTFSDGLLKPRIEKKFVRENKVHFDAEFALPIADEYGYGVTDKLIFPDVFVLEAKESIRIKPEKENAILEVSLILPSIDIQRFLLGDSTVGIDIGSDEILLTGEEDIFRIPFNYIEKLRELSPLLRDFIFVKIKSDRATNIFVN